MFSDAHSLHVLVHEAVRMLWHQETPEHLVARLGPQAIIVCALANAIGMAIMDSAPPPGSTIVATSTAACPAGTPMVLVSPMATAPGTIELSKPDDSALLADPDAPTEREALLAAPPDAPTFLSPRRILLLAVLGALIGAAVWQILTGRAGL
jgi:hypothetical protein